MFDQNLFAETVNVHMLLLGLETIVEEAKNN